MANGMPDSSQRAKQIFIELIRDVRAEDWDRQLEERCAHDPELHVRVSALLRAHREPGSFLAQPALVPGADLTVDHSPTETLGDRIGPYKLLEQVGEGGMGLVFIAEQLQPVRRNVALKVIKPGLDTARVIARFEQERQALAMMDHPHIAKVLDAGTTARGRPYFVMELVKGVPITKFCDREHLSCRERLELFIPVCQAVQHAHQKGIIHRDIKPSNVLIGLYDGRPVPKVIDFGVAKATGGHLSASTLHTDVGSIVGTLEYMAPEQAELNNLDIDTRADIYSLGVLLYELLTGSPPFTREQLRSAAFDEMLRMIREVEPPKPSTRLSNSDELPSIAAARKLEPASLARLVTGELDWIVMKCLAKERQGRYETASGLALDIGRYLAGEPVVAHPPSAGYRLRKFVNRNKPQVIAASLVLFALLAGVIGTTLGLLEARRQTAIAREQRQRAIEFRDKALDALRATTGTDVEQLIGGKPNLGANEKAYLEAIAKRWQAFADQEGTDEQSRSISAEGHFRVAYLWQKLGRQEDARREYEQALGLREKLAADFPAVPVYRRDLAMGHNNLGLLLADLGKQSEAEEQYRKALAIFESLAGGFPAVPEYRQELASSHNNLGILLSALGKQSEAEQQYRKALAIQENLAAEFRAAPAYRQDLARIHNSLGVLLDDLGKRAEAEQQYRKGLSIQEQLAAEFPVVPEYRQELAQCHNNLGTLLADLGKRPEAEEQCRKGLSIREQLASEFPAVPMYRQDLAQSQHNLGATLASLGKQSEAEEQFRKGLSIEERLAAELPTVPAYRRDLASSHNNLGAMLRNIGSRSEAEEELRKALALREKLAAEFPTVPEYRQDLASSRNSLGNLLRDLGKQSEAEVQYRSALSILAKLAADFPAVPEYRRQLADCHNNLGILLNDLGKWPAAEEQYRKGLSIQEQLAAEFPAVPEYRSELAFSHQSLGILLNDLGKRPEAEEQHRNALSIRDKLAAEFPTVPEYRRDLAWSHNSLGALFKGLGKWPDAEEQCRKGLSIQENLAAEFPTVPMYRQDLAQSHNNLGNLLSALGKQSEAEEQYRKGLSIREQLAADFPAVPAYRQDLAMSHNNLGNLLSALGKQSEAEEQYRKGLSIQEQLAADFTAMPAYRQDLAMSHNNLGALLAGLSKRPEAEEQFHKGLSIREQLAADFPAVPAYRQDLAMSHNNLGALLADLGNRPEAEKHYRKALSILEQLAAEFPAVSEYQVDLGRSYFNFGSSFVNDGMPVESLPWFQKATDTLRPILDAEPRNVTASRLLRDSHWYRAVAHHQLREFAEAVKDWDLAIELSAPLERLGLQAYRATSRLQAGQVAEAIAEVAELIKSPGWESDQLYNFACIYSVASGRIAHKQQEYADRAMELLQKAVEAGYTDAAHMQQDTDLDPIRDREDLKQLLADLAAKSAAKP